MYRFINDQGSVLFVQRPREARDVQAFLDRQPRVLPTSPATAPQMSGGAVLLALRLVALLLVVIALATAFFLFGEKTPETIVRPLLTAHQRAQAFRL